MNPTDLNGWAAHWAPCMVRACWQGAVAVAGVWAVCRFLPRLPPAVRATLWWLVCLKTLLSLATAGPVPLTVLPATLPPATFVSSGVPPNKSSSVMVAKTTKPLLPNIARPAPARTAVETPPRLKSIAPVSVALCLWLAGVLFLLGGFLLELRTSRRLAERATPCDDAVAIQEVAHAIGLARLPPVLVSERADCSLVIGLCRPAIVLCRKDLARLSPREVRALLAHELAHIRRRDLWIGILPNLARLLFFFDPLVWLACREYDLARETACDAEALRVSGLPPADYGRLLLKLGIVSPSFSQHSGRTALGAASPYSALLRRRLQGIKTLGRSSSPARWHSILVLTAVAASLSLHPVRGNADTIAAASPTIRRGAGTADAPPAKHTPLTSKVAALASPAFPTHVVAPAAPATSRPDSIIKKEDLAMSKFLNGRKATLSVVALAAAAAPMLTAPAAAQEPSAPPVPASPPVVPGVPATPASPAPVAPVAPVSSVESPSAPAAPDVTQPMRYQYTLRQGKSYMNHTQTRDVADGQRALARAQPSDCLIVDRDGHRYLITDAATLRRIRDNYAPIEAIGKQMEAKGKEMENAGKPMEDVGKQMEAKGIEMGAIGQRIEELGKRLEASFNDNKPETDRRAIQESMRALQEQMRKPQEEMRALAQKMRDQGAKMRPLGDQMREQGRQMRAAAKEAEEHMTGIIDTAFRDNLAIERKAP